MNASIVRYIKQSIILLVHKAIAIRSVIVSKMSVPESNGQPSAEMLESRQAAMKNRIITHLNADHAFSLQIYLRHFCGVPEKQASNAKLTDITNDHMIIESRAGRNLVPFEPPMKSFMEARERTVALHNQALKGLGLSDIKITNFALPNKIWQIVTCISVIMCLITFPFRSSLHPSSGSFVSQIWSFGGLVPGISKLAYTLSPFLLPFILIVHTIEAENFTRTRLRKHQMPFGSIPWVLWTIHAFIGGIACFARFDDLVQEREDQQKKNEKH